MSITKNLMITKVQNNKSNSFCLYQLFFMKNIPQLCSKSGFWNKISQIA